MNGRFMKRLRVGFCLCLVFLSSFGRADESVAFGSPILFRDYPWGIGLTEVVQDFKQETLRRYGQLYSDEEINPEAFEYALMPYGDCFSPFESECFCGEHSTKCSFKVSGMLSVAGYEDVFANVYSVADVTEEGTIIENIDDSHLFHGQYNFSVARKAGSEENAEDEAIYDDLLIKLTALYGEGIEEESGTGLFRTYKTVWFGADNTAVVLDWGYSGVTVDYWDIDSCNMIQKISGVLAVEDAVSLDVDGL